MMRGLFSPVRTATSSGSVAAVHRSSEELMQLESKYNANNYKPVPVVISKGRGCYVWDVENNRYLDFLSAYSAVNQGHAHPRIISALVRQAQQLTLTSRAFYNDALGDFTKFITGYFGYERVLPMNTGVEAWETACKLARRWGYDVKGIPNNQARLVFAKNNFHGRSIAALSASSDPDCYGGFGPYVPGFDKIPFDDLAALEKAVSNPNVAAYIVEPIQGEAGAVVPSAGYIARAAEICRRHNVLFVADEVQTGLGRTGRLLACDYDGVKPDILILGKALSGGTIPVSCVLSSDEVMLTIKPGQHGSTFGGNPLAARVTTTALEVLRDEGMIENSFHMGHLFRTKLAEMNSPLVRTIRGRGLMNAIVLRPGSRGESAWEVCLRLKENGLLCKPTHGQTIRLSPPLIISEEQVLEGVDIIQRTLQSFE